MPLEISIYSLQGLKFCFHAGFRRSYFGRARRHSATPNTALACVPLPAKIADDDAVSIFGRLQILIV
jgi:hypothetical protein